VQVHVLGHVAAQLVQDQAEPVPARGAAPLQQPFGRQRGYQPVHSALAEAELAGEFGDAELLAGPGERAEHPGRVAHRRQRGPARWVSGCADGWGWLGEDHEAHRSSVPLCGTTSLVWQAAASYGLGTSHAWGLCGTDPVV